MKCRIERGGLTGRRNIFCTKFKIIDGYGGKPTQPFEAVLKVANQFCVLQAGTPVYIIRKGVICNINLTDKSRGEWQTEGRGPRRGLELPTFLARIKTSPWWLAVADGRPSPSPAATRDRAPRRVLRASGSSEREAGQVIEGTIGNPSNSNKKP